ncbi:MAG: ATP-binding protein, partial [Thiohalocapsa sp.]
MFRDLVLLVLITVGALAAVNALLIDDLKHDLAEARIGSATALVRDEVRSLLTPVQQQLLILHDALRSNDLAPDDTRALNAQMMPALTHIDQIAAAVFADESGAEYFLGRTEGGWLTRERPAGDADGSMFSLTRWSGADESLDSETAAVDHDPRERPWFRLAKAQLNVTDTDTGTGSEDRALTWSPPYRFHTLGVPGTTASIAWREDGRLLVAAFDVTLRRIIEAVDTLDLGAGGAGFLFNDMGGIYSGTDDADQGGFYSAERQPGGTLAFEAVAAWR